MLDGRRSRRRRYRRTRHELYTAQRAKRHQNGSRSSARTSSPMHLIFFLKERCVHGVSAKNTDSSCCSQQNIEIVHFLNSRQKNHKKYKQKCKNCNARTHRPAKSANKHISGEHRHTCVAQCPNWAVLITSAPTRVHFLGYNADNSCTMGMEHVSL